MTIKETKHNGGQFKKGVARPKKAGRKKGTPNKSTATIRNMIVNALDKAGGEMYLLKQAKENPNAFLTLIGKVLPTQLTGDEDNPIVIQSIEWKALAPKD